MSDATVSARQGGDEVTSAISRGVGEIYARLYGRGPTATRGHIGDDFVLIVLEQTFTQAERTLAEAGNHAQIVRTRRAFQEAVRGDFIEIVETATGRGVAVFMSQVDVPTETAVELFLLDTPGADGE